MILTPRERQIAIVTAGDGGVLVIVFYSLIHYVQTRHEVAGEIETKQKEKQKIMDVLQRPDEISRRNSSRWSPMA